MLDVEDRCVVLHDEAVDLCDVLSQHVQVFHVLDQCLQQLFELLLLVLFFLLLDPAQLSLHWRRLRRDRVVVARDDEAFEVADFFLEQLDAVLLVRVVVRRVGQVHHRGLLVLFDLLRLLRVLEAVKGLFDVARVRRDADDHQHRSVSPERVFEQPCEFRVAVRDEGVFALLAVGQDVDAVGERQQRLVDIRAFLDDVLGFQTHLF